MILHSLAETLRRTRENESHSHDSEANAPITPAEFARRFQPYEEGMQTFLARVAHGDYRELGIAPDMIPSLDEDEDYKVEPDEEEDEDEDMDLAQGAFRHYCRSSTPIG